MSTEPTKQEPSIQNKAPDADKAVSTPEVKEEISKVAASPKRNIMVLISMGVGFAVMAYNLLAPQFFSQKKDDINDHVSTPSTISKPAESTSDAPPIPKLPEPPKLVAPAPPAPTEEPKPMDMAQMPSATATPQAANMPSAAPAVLPSEIVSNSDDAKKRKEAKRKSSIVLIAGVPPKKSDAEIAQLANFKKRGDLTHLLSQGKVIDAVTETAINTDFGGEVRAVVSRDVYSEDSKIVVIPKGSRVFGAYKTGVDATYGRVSIAWNRIDLASGYTLNFAGDAIDNLGRKGIHGRVDNKYVDTMTNAVLMSAISIGIAAGIDKLVPPVSNTQTAANAQVATNMQNSAQATFTSTLTEQQKVAQICANVQGMFPDKTATSYTTFVATCNTATTTVGAQPGQLLNSMMSAVTTATTALLSSTVAATTPTHRQQAAQQAFTDLTNTVSTITKSAAPKPNITIDQGYQVKIYVRKDYLFPKDAISKSKVLQ